MLPEIAIAGEWVEVSAKQMAELKELRSKLGGGARRGFTEKNRVLLRRFDDPQLAVRLAQLPDKLWRSARRALGSRKLAFVELQNSLAIDILLHAPLRIQNLAALRFDQNIHWPQGRGKPALLIIDAEETKNDNPIEFELPKYLSDRLYAFRHEFAPPVIGKIPEALFISRNGLPRVIATLRVAIQKAVRGHLGVQLSPHQFRHLAGKFHLDENPGAYEPVRQLLTQKDLRTTTSYYAPINTRRAGRAHAALIARFREGRPKGSLRDLKRGME